MLTVVYNVSCLLQADNQLFGTQRPIMLYVTPTTRRDVSDNTPALHIAAHKVPNANCSI